ncbi:MAG: hypothetical protein J0G28_07715 [Afipia sp.]|nr:hypothetical protein [Afipia sp.]
MRSFASRGSGGWKLSENGNGKKTADSAGSCKIRMRDRDGRAGRLAVRGNLA